MDESRDDRSDLVHSLDLEDDACMAFKPFGHTFQSPAGPVIGHRATEILQKHSASNKGPLQLTILPWPAVIGQAAHVVIVPYKCSVAFEAHCTCTELHFPNAVNELPFWSLCAYRSSPVQKV